MLRRSLHTLAFLLLVWIIAVQAGCLSFRTSDSKWEEKLQEKGQFLQPRFIDAYDSLAQRNIHAVSIAAADSLPVWMFVHGSPGSSDAFLHLLSDTSLSRQYRMITVDRPGFGYSGFGKAECSLEAQARAIKLVIDQIAPNQPVFLAGHSYGGPVVVRFAIDYPEQTAGLLLLAASVDPKLEPDTWWMPVVDNPPICWLTPKSMYTSNREIIALKKELENMMPLWQRITCPVVVQQAVNDVLVPAGNADFAKNMLDGSARVRIDSLPTGNHFFIWSKPEVVKEGMLKLVNSRQPTVNSQ